MNRVVHFEIHAAEPERAARFYRDVFGWEVTQWAIAGVEIKPENQYWLVTTGAQPDPGINGGIVVRRGAPAVDEQAVNAYVCTIGVTSVDAAVSRAIGAGGTPVVPKMPITGVGWLAYCKDTEGNIFGVMQEDPDAR